MIAQCRSDRCRSTNPSRQTRPTRSPWPAISVLLGCPNLLATVADRWLCRSKPAEISRSIVIAFRSSTPTGPSDSRQRTDRSRGASIRFSWVRSTGSGGRSAGAPERSTAVASDSPSEAPVICQDPSDPSSLGLPSYQVGCQRSPLGPAPTSDHPGSSRIHSACDLAPHHHS